MAKRITREQVLGEQGVSLIGRRFLDMGFLWHPTNAPLDAGIDGFVELRDSSTGEASNAWVAVQSKARTGLEKETDETFEFTCTPRDLEYWRRGNMPVLLVVSRPDSEEAWWVSVKDYFRQPSRQGTRRIIFDKRANALQVSAKAELLSLAQSAGAGTYFRPSPKRELLHSNLLEVTRLPTCLYRGDSNYKSPSELHRALRNTMQYPPREWVLNAGVIYSIHDLRDDPWTTVCDRGTVETIETDEWSESSDADTRRRFVWLMNDCLRSLCGKIGMRYDKSDNLFYFKKTRDLSPRRKSYKSRKQAATRTVFKEYRSPKDPAKVAYYRHVGFEPRFRKFDGKWYLEINPTYRFTSDGETPHPFREEYLSKIKSIEGSGAVGGLVVMFAALLADREGLFADNYPHLGFGSLLGVEMPVGIDDAAWRRRDANAPSVTASANNDDMEDAGTDAELLFSGDIG